MGLHEAAVKLGLIYTNNNDAEMHLARYIEHRFKLAGDIFLKSVILERKNLRFKDCLKIVWKENDNIKKFYVFDSFLEKTFPDLCGKEKPIEISPSEVSFGSYAETYHIDNKYVGMCIKTGIIDKSTNEKELKHNLTIILGTVYHECDHIYSKNESAEIDDFETALLYYMDKAEIRAHSKQFAHDYYLTYPKTHFNYHLLKKCIETKYKPTEKICSTLRYIELMRSPSDFHSNNAEIMEYIKNRIFTIGHKTSQHQLKIAFRRYMNYITYFVKKFNESNTDWH